MPELPDVDVYVDTIWHQTGNKTLADLRIGNPFLLRSLAPRPDALVGRAVSAVRRIGKRIAIGFDNDCWSVIHLMIAGRFQWQNRPPTLKSKTQLAAFDFEHGSLLLTEAGSKKRASMHIVDSSAALSDHDPGGIEPLGCHFGDFAAVLRRKNHTLKRALTDPRILSGIGNAYSDEILHRAKLSPVALTQKLDDDDIRALLEATHQVLIEWRTRLLEEAGTSIPAKVTAFRPEMAVHGKFGEPCPVCTEAVQRIRYKSNETNYCARCQTGGKLLRDRSLSLLLKRDWPKTLDDL